MGCVESSTTYHLPGCVVNIVGGLAPVVWCVFADSTHPDMVVVAGPVPAGTYKIPVNTSRLSVPKGTGLARESRLGSGCGVLTMQPWRPRDPVDSDQGTW